MTQAPQTPFQHLLRVSQALGVQAFQVEGRPPSRAPKISFSSRLYETYDVESSTLSTYFVAL